MTIQSYKSESEWQEIVEKQLASGLKPSNFCEMYKIEYSTFLKARAKVKKKIQIENELKMGSSFLDKLQKKRKTGLIDKKQEVENNVNFDDNVNIDNSNYKKLLGANDEVELISSTIIKKTQHVLDNELNKFINLMGVEKDIKQINVQKLKDLSVAVLKTVYTNDIQKRRLELEIIRSNIEAEKLLIEKEKLHLEKLKLGLVKDETQADNGFVDALKDQGDLWDLDDQEDQEEEE
jgi:hypothetical protein